MAVSFRTQARPSDIQAVREIVKSTGFFEAVADEIDCAVKDISDTVNLGEADSGSTYVFIEEDGATVGFASYGPVDCTDNLFYMYWIAVRGDIRGKGYGKMLMRKTLEEIAAKHARKVVLQTSGRPQYLPTREFYIACGFKKEAEIADYYQDGESSVYYSVKFK